MNYGSKQSSWKGNGGMLKEYDEYDLVRSQDANSALKAAITYMKKFPQKSEPFFWNIIACALAGTDGYSSESDRKIMSGLAFGFLSKAAADASANNVSPEIQSLSLRIKSTLKLNLGTVN